MQTCNILHVIPNSHPLWQVHAKSHLTLHTKLRPPLASTCKVTSYTSYQTPTPSGKYMQTHILHVIPNSHPLWQVHANTHLARHTKLPPPLASTCKVTSYTSYQTPTPSGKYMQSHILHFIPNSDSLWQVHAKSYPYTSYQTPTPSGKYMQTHILHVIPNSHPLWQVHAKSHLTLHTKLRPPLASTCKHTSCTSYQTPTPSGKYMQSHILHFIPNSDPLWQVHANTHLARHTKLPPPLASTCKVTSYTSYQTPTPSGKYMQTHILHVIPNSHPLWQVHAKSHLTLHTKLRPPLASTCDFACTCQRGSNTHLARHTKLPPPLASTCKVTSYTSYQTPTPSGKYMQTHILHVIPNSHPLWQVHAKSHLTLHTKLRPPLASTCKHTSCTSYQTPTPSGKYMQSHILHFIPNSDPLWQVHANTHLARHTKLPPPLASTCKVTSYTSYQTPTPSGKYMQSHILHFIPNSDPLWQVHAKSHLTLHTKLRPPLASTCKHTSCTSYQTPTPSGKYMQSHILHFIPNSDPLWQVHANTHLARHTKLPPPLASTCKVTSYTSYQTPTPSGKYMQSHILHVIPNSHPLWQVHAKSHLTLHTKLRPPLASTCKHTSCTSYQTPTPSGKYMQSHILHFIPNSDPLWQVHANTHLARHTKLPPPLASTCKDPLWQVHANTHLARHTKLPPPLASTCKVTSYTSYQTPTPSGKYMQSHILHVIPNSHPLWQVHAKSHLTLHTKLRPPLASTCKHTSCTSYQTPTPSGKYMQSHILHFIPNSDPLWQVHAKSHLARHTKLPPPLASTCKVTSYTSYQTPTPSGKYMQTHILHVIPNSHPLWQVHAKSHLTLHTKLRPPLASTCKHTSCTSYQTPTPSGKYMQSHILHFIPNSDPLWQVHANTHLARHTKLPPPLASTCKVTSYTSYQTPTPSGKYMQTHILHVIPNSHPLWQVHAKSHLTLHTKLRPPLASTCKHTSCTSYQTPTPSGKYMQSHILHFIPNSDPLWQVHANTHLARHTKLPPPLASTCKVTSYTSYQTPTPSGKYMQTHILHVIPNSHPLWQVHAKSHLTLHTKLRPPLASTCKHTSCTSYQTPTPSGKYMQSHILNFIPNSHPLWQVHANTHLARHTKLPPPLASTCTPSGKSCKHTSYTSYQTPDPLWQVHAKSHLTLHTKLRPPLASTCKHTSCTSYQTPTPSGKYMQSHILHFIPNSDPLWQVHANTHLARHTKLPPPLASTCKVTSYTSYQTPTPSGKYMQSHILHVIPNSHPLWQVHAKSHLTLHTKLRPPLASTCKVTSYTSYQTPTPSGKYMQSHILHFIPNSDPLWQVHAKSHLARHTKLPPPLASTCKVTSYTSYQTPTPSGKYMQTHILHVIPNSHPLWQVHAKSHLTLHTKLRPPLASTCKVTSYTSYQTPPLKYMQSHILHFIPNSDPLWQVHANTHLARHTKLPPPLASTCKVTSYTSYQTPTPSGKYMQTHILHVIPNSHPLWQVHAKSHLTLHTKLRPPLASTCKHTSCTSYQTPTPSGKYMQSHILHFIPNSDPLWQVHANTHLARHTKLPPPLASTCKVTSYTSYQTPTPSGKYMQTHILHVIPNSHPLWQVHAKSHLTLHTKLRPPLASTCKHTSCTSYQTPTPSGKYMQSHILHFIPNSDPLWQVHANTHLARHTKLPPPLASTCKVTSYTSYQTPTPSGKYMQTHILHVIPNSHPLWQVHAKSHLTLHTKLRPPLASTCKHTSCTSYQTPTPSGKYMQSHILHFIPNSDPLWQVHANTHLARHTKLPPPLASTCKVTSYTSYQTPTPSGKYMQTHILHVIPNSHPLWQVHAKSHLTLHTKLRPPLASTCKHTSCTSYQTPTPSGKYMQSHILHFIPNSDPLWQVHANTHLARHTKLPPPLASTCKVTSYTSYQTPTPSGKYMQTHILHVIPNSHPLWQVHAKSHLTLHTKLRPPLASTCKHTSCTSYQTPTPSGKYMQSHILHFIPNSDPLWQVHANTHLARHTKLPPPLASTCKVTSYTSYQTPTPSGKYMQTHILHVIPNSHPLWQVHAKSHLTLHTKLRPPLASTCKHTSCTSYQTPTPSGKYMQSHILHFIPNSDPLWQVHANTHLARHTKLPPPLASTCKVTSYTSYQTPTPSGKYMQTHILHVIPNSHPLWQVHAKSHLTLHTKLRPPLASTCKHTSCTSYQTPTPSGKYMQSHILHFIPNSDPLWQVHANTHLARHTKLPPPLASTCKVTSYTSYQTPTPSGKYMQSHILHFIPNSHPLWQVHAKSHLTLHTKLPPPLASTCKVTSYTSYQTPTPSGKYMQTHILHVIPNSHPLWQVHAKSHLTLHTKLRPPLASTCKVTSYTSYQTPTPSGKYMQTHILHVIPNSHPLWQVHAKSHLTLHTKLRPPLASTCKVTSYTSYQTPTPSGKYMQTHILHVIPNSHPLWQVHAKSHLTLHTKLRPPLASTCKVTSYTSYQTPTPSGKYMQTHILHVIPNSDPLWQVHAKSHLTLHTKLPPPLASTCKVTSYTSYQTPTPSGKYMQTHILHVIPNSHPLWQVHAKSHLTLHTKLRPPLASTCKVTSYTSYQTPTPSGKYMQTHILHVIPNSHPLWQVHAKSHLTLHTKLRPPLASTCKHTSCTSYQTPTPSGKYMQSHILHFIPNSDPLWQVHANTHLARHTKLPPPLASTCKVTSYTSYQTPTPSGKYMQTHILHVIPNSHPLWQVHAKSHLTLHTKLRPPLASTCKHTSCTSYQTPTPSGKYMQSHILHFIPNSDPLWQVHANTHLARHTKLPPPLASTCKVTSYTSYQTPTPSGKYMQTHILHVIPNSHPLWQVHAKSHLTLHTKLRPPLASTCKVTSYTSYQTPTPSGKYMQVDESWISKHSLRLMVYEANVNPMIFVIAKIVDLFRVPGGTPPSWRTQMASELSKGPWRGPGKSSPKEEIGATRVGKTIYIYNYIYIIMYIYIYTQLCIYIYIREVNVNQIYLGVKHRLT